MSSMPMMRRFYQDPYLLIRSFTLNLVTCVAACAALYTYQSPEFYNFEFQAWHLAFVPLGIYLGGISAVFIHNATHGSFPIRWMNWWAGQLAGMHQLWGFTGWKIIHLVHHQYSDDVNMDPHPPAGKPFGQFLRTMFVHSSAKITERYREHYGMTARTKALQTAVYVVFISLAVVHIAFWYLLLGPEVFVFGYIPSYITNHLLFAHINYYAHPQNAQTGEYNAGNMDSNLYYKLANFFWCGIYYHDNHHRKPMLFNPKKMATSKRRDEVSQEMDLAA
jgi:stearoyl-CoA desaturase (delta-9 desaturase)